MILRMGPLYRLYLLKENEGSYYFYATIHHLIFDGFTRRLFVQELNSIYKNAAEGTTISLPRVNAYSYDFAASEKSELSAEKEEELGTFWKENLKDLPAELRFPYDYPRSNEPTGYGFREYFEIAPEATASLRKLSSETGTSVFNTLLSALGLLFQKYTGEDDVCIGIPVSTRRSADSFRTFGLMVNTLAIRLRNESESSFRKKY